MKGDTISMIVNGFRKEVFRAPSMEFATDTPGDVADGVNALKSPERATTLATHSRHVPDSIVPPASTCRAARIATSGGQERTPEVESRGCEWVREAAFGK